MALHGKNRDGGGGGAGDTNDLASNWVSSAGASQSPPSLQSNPEVWHVQIRKLNINPWVFQHSYVKEGSKTQPKRSTTLC